MAVLPCADAHFSSEEHGNEPSAAPQVPQEKDVLGPRIDRVDERLRCCRKRPHRPTPRDLVGLWLFRAFSRVRTASVLPLGRQLLSGGRNHMAEDKLHEYVCSLRRWTVFFDHIHAVKA